MDDKAKILAELEQALGLVEALRQGKVPGLEFGVTLFMEEEKRSDSFVEAVSHLYRRIEEEKPKGSINGGTISTIWIDCYLDGKIIGALMPPQVADISRAFGVFTWDDKLADKMPLIDPIVFSELLAKELDESATALTAHHDRFMKIYREIQAKETIADETPAKDSAE